MSTAWPLVSPAPSIARGQHIEIGPAAKVVVAMQSYWPRPFNDALTAHNDAFVDALIRTIRTVPRRMP